MSTSPYASIVKESRHLPHWLAVTSDLSSGIPENAAHWLLDNTSLTLRVKNHCMDHDLGCFSVQVLEQKMAMPLDDEIQHLKLKNNDDALIREVLLYCHESPLIYARTIIPAQTLTGEQRELGELGDRPLGEFLFSQPGLKRDVMEVAALRQGHQLFDSASAHISVKAQEIWARRSVFRLEHKPLLVAEVFLPE
ncbi:MAG: chorismate lyase, partial [Thiotrichaceae bacterium]|nr:chorismate lyase [Thiotrichaceae bacterium]